MHGRDASMTSARKPKPGPKTLALRPSVVTGDCGCTTAPPAPGVQRPKESEGRTGKWKRQNHATVRPKSYTQRYYVHSQRNNEAREPTPATERPSSLSATHPSRHLNDALGRSSPRTPYKAEDMSAMHF